MIIHWSETYDGIQHQHFADWRIAAQLPIGSRAGVLRPQHNMHVHIHDVQFHAFYDWRIGAERTATTVDIASSIDVVSTVSGSIAKTAGLSVSVSGASGVDGAIIRTRYISSSVGGESSISATFASLIQMAASVAAVATAGANIIRGRLLGGSSDSVITVTSSIKAINYLKSVVSAAADLAGKIWVKFDLKGTSGSSSSAMGELGGGKISVRGGFQTFMARLRRKNR